MDTRPIQDFDPNDLEALKDFIDRLRAAGVKSFRHPNGIEVTFDRAETVAPRGRW